MKILITVAFTALALGVSILSVNSYILFLSKHRVLTSLWQVPFIFIGYIICVVFLIFVPIAIVAALYDNLHYPAAYEKAALVAWAIASFSYVVSRLRRKS